MDCWICVCSGFGIKCDTFCVLFAAAMEGSPHKRARASKAQREVMDCGSVRELFNFLHNSLINFTGALLDMSDLHSAETSKAGRDCNYVGRHCNLQPKQSFPSSMINVWYAHCQMVMLNVPSHQVSCGT